MAEEGKRSVPKGTYRRVVTHIRPYWRGLLGTFLFGQINDGNCLAMPYAKGFGWAAELNLQDCYRKLFEHERGVGYPKERAAIMAKNRGILKQLKLASCKDMLSVLGSVDQELLKAAVSGEKFQELFFQNCQDEAIATYVKRLLG